MLDYYQLLSDATMMQYKCTKKRKIAEIVRLSIPSSENWVKGYTSQVFKYVKSIYNWIENNNISIPEFESYFIEKKEGGYRTLRCF